jgi:hypothetical protein
MASPFLDKRRSPESGRRVVLTTAGIAVANLTVFFVVLARKLEHFDARSAPEFGGGLAADMWLPLFALGLTQIAVTGLLLSAWKATRAIGIGLFACAAAGATAIAALGFFLVLVIGS